MIRVTVEALDERGEPVEMLGQITLWPADEFDSEMEYAVVDPNPQRTVMPVPPPERSGRFIFSLAYDRWWHLLSLLGDALKPKQEANDG